jgi:hypothetical protein
MRSVSIALLVLLLPAALFAIPNMGVYFTPLMGQMSYSPQPYEEFSGYVWENGAECYITASEFRIATPPGIVLTGFDIPEGSLNIGDPVSGVSITYWPPLNGFETCQLLCTMHFVAMNWCGWFGLPHGVLVDSPMAVVPHPDTGRIAVTCWPENAMYDLVGLTSTICPLQIGVHETSWGGIKALYK